MKSQVLHTVLGNISSEAAGEIWNWLACPHWLPAWFDGSAREELVARTIASRKTALPREGALKTTRIQIQWRLACKIFCAFRLESSLDRSSATRRENGWTQNAFCPSGENSQKHARRENSKWSIPVRVNRLKPCRLRSTPFTCGSSLRLVKRQPVK